MKRLLALVVLLAGAAGCDRAATRAWQSSEMPTHDAQRVFEAAREVLERNFEVAEASFAKGVIVTRPQAFERSRSGTLADVRGAGGKWRRTVSFELDRAGLAVVARVAVRLERESTAAAMAIADATTGERPDELPRVGPQYGRTAGRSSEEVWTEVGYDAALARELLAAIAEAVGKGERSEAMPAVPTAKDVDDETRRSLPARNR